MFSGTDPGNTSSTARVSEGSEIVELVVLTADAAFFNVLKSISGQTRRLWQVPAADKVGPLLLAGQVGILVADVQALPGPPSAFVSEIKRQFPNLVVIVAGKREDEISLAALISAGAIYRFIHKPMSPGRAKSFVETAVKKYQEQRRLSAGASGGTTLFSRRRFWLAALSGLAVVLAILWVGIFHRRPNTARLPPPVGSELTPSAAATGAGSMTTQLDNREQLLSNAENALSEDRLDETAAALVAARKAGSNSPRLIVLTAKLGRAREARRSKDAAAVRTAGLLADARSAIERKDFPQAVALLDAVSGIAAPADEESVLQLLRVTRKAEIDARERPLARSAPVPQPADAAPGGPATAATTTPVTADLVTAAAPMTADPATSDPSHPAVMSSGRLKLIKSVKPRYPRRAELSKRQGWVELSFTVTTTGTVTDIAVTAADPGGVFDSAAVEALAQWRYQPVLDNGQPVPQRSKIKMRFVTE